MPGRGPNGYVMIEPPVQQPGDSQQPMASPPPVQFVEPEGQACPASRLPQVTVATEVQAKDRFAWLLSSLAFLALLSFFLPYTVEKMSYALSRGRQRALYETAGETLRNVALKDLSDAYQLVANRVGPSVVHINVTTDEDELSSQPAAALGWRHPTTSQGSGVIVDPEGFIVTNAHVIRGYKRIRVRLSDGRSIGASVVGVDRPTDMAVLKVSSDKLIAAEWGDSDALDVGALVWALGSPLGLQHSVTFGILSGKNRSFTAEQRFDMLDAQGVSSSSPYHSFLQTDAAVNPGNSGGPLVDSQGRVVGINTAIVGEAYQGISFAIPSSIAKPIYERLRGEGRVVRGWLGVDPQDITPDLAARWGLQTNQGALIVAVVPNLDGALSPAQLAGLEAGDVITGWDGQSVSGRSQLFALVALTPVGSPIDVVVLRGEQEITLNVTVAERPPGVQ